MMAFLKKEILEQIRTGKMMILGILFAAVYAVYIWLMNQATKSVEE